MDSLPVELVTHILKRLPVQHVFPLMRVSQKFEAAARAVIRSKRRLGLGGGLDSSRKSSRPMPAIDTLAWPSKQHMGSFVLSMSRMTNLRVLRIVDCEERHDLQHVADLLIRQNGHSLQQVCLDFDFSFPAFSPPLHSFPKLEKLFCYRLFDEKVLSACPALTTVFCYDLPASALQRLHKDKVTGLKTDRIDTDSIPLLSQFLNLQVLHVNELILSGPCDQLFHQMHDLVHVHISSPSDVFIDHLMVRLCQNNVNLRSIRLTMEEGGVGDVSLAAMSRLSHLRTVQLDVRWSHMTTSGLVSLLRGKSRSLLKLLFLIIWAEGRDDVDRSVVAAEVRAINRESAHRDRDHELHFLHE